jgi:D-3-phosphoglycerate dehydrogenase / 2-oxoglutarate reductase
MPAPIRLLITEGAQSRFVFYVHKTEAGREFDLLIPGESAEAELRALAPGADAILCYQANLPAAVIDAAPRLKFIQKHGPNFRHIDVAAAARRGIPVATMSLLRDVTVAEHALMLMLACARNLLGGYRAVTGAVYREMGITPFVTTQSQYGRNWANLKGVNELYQASAGIIGMGGIGMEIAKRCRAFGMSVSYYQRTRHDAATERALGAHYPHTPETEKIINADRLARMRPTATLINVGRGALVDEAALVAALNEGRIAMAGLDVYQVEPLPAESPLLTMPNVVLQPHTGGGSYRSWDVDMPASLANIRRYFAQGRAEGIVNPA